jgi:hypothetical protein
MATQSTNNEKTDIRGEFLPTYLKVSGFCGSFTGYLKGSINGWTYNGEFLNNCLYNAELQGIFKGTMNAYGYIKKSEITTLPNEWEKGDYDYYMNNDDSEEDNYSEYDYDNSDNDDNTMN